MSQQHTPSRAPSVRLTEMILSLWVPQTIYTAASLRIPDELALGPKRSNELASAVNAHPDAIDRLLRALVSLELCAKTSDGAFELTPLGACLRSDGPDSVRSWALLMGRPHVWRAWGRLVDCVRTGEHAWKLEGADLFEFMKANPEEAEIFNQAMLELTNNTAREVAAAYDFVGVREIVDVGGGYGQLVAAILGMHPNMRGVVFDLPHCQEGAEQLIEKQQLSGRVKFVVGDFFESVPAGADAYLLKWVVHDWNDERSLTILRRCRAAMHEQARLLVIEVAAPEQVGLSPFDNIFIGSDLTMLVNTGGRERTEAQYRKLLEMAGLRVTRIIATASEMSVIEALPAVGTRA